jgi:hypothetical protein
MYGHAPLNTAMIDRLAPNVHPEKIAMYLSEIEELGKAGLDIHDVGSSRSNSVRLRSGGADPKASIMVRTRESSRCLGAHEEIAR